MAAKKQNTGRVEHELNKYSYSVIKIALGGDMGTKTEFPASYYGNIDGKNPVVRSFKQEINSFLALMKRVTSLPILENNAYAKG